MKKQNISVICFLLLLSSTNHFSSQGKDGVSVKGNGFEVSLENKVYNFFDEQKNQFTIRDYYEYTDESLSGYYKLPSRNLIFAIPPDAKVQVSLVSSTVKKYLNVIPTLNPELELINDSTFSVKEVEYADRKSLQDNRSIVEIQKYFWLRDFYCVQIRLNTHSFDEKTNSLSELSDIVLRVDFDKRINIKDSSPIENKSPFDDNLRLLFSNSEIAEQFRGTPNLNLNDTTGDWINYSANYLKFGTASDGIFRITKADIENFGINTSNINPLTFQLFESGIEKPIYVFGETDLSFDNGDYIEFYGTKNYSKISPREINPNNQPYNNYLDKYTDTTIYFLTWGITNGKRAETINSFLSSAADTLAYYTNFIHLEENIMDALFYTFHNDLVESQFPFWDTGKGWYWMWLATWATPRVFTIPVSDLVANKTANFYGKVVSRGSTGSTNVHVTKLLINNTRIDSQVTNRYQRVLLQGSINSNALINGNNTLQITYGEAGGASNGQMIIDWVEAEYPRKLKFNDDNLFFEYRDLTNTDLRFLKIESVLDTNFVLYKVRPTLKRISKYQLTGTNLLFTDTVSNGDAYILVKNGNTFKPKFIALKTFANLRSQNEQSDYIGITHPAFYGSVNNYLNFISENFSVTTNLTLVDDIFDEFGYGYPTAEAVREFILTKFQNAPAPKPAYLVLFGDANYDYKKYRTASQGIIGGGNFVPSYGYPVSDQYYAVWGESSLPQMFVGRIPLNTNTEMDFYKSKVQNNLTEPYDDWNKKYLFFSGGRGNLPDEINLYKSVSDSVINNFVAVPPLKGVYKHFYKTYDPQSDFGPYSASEIQRAIDAGGVFISYIGHSGTATWDNSISDVRQLKNKINRNPIITDFGCSTNKFAEPDIVAFGERFILDTDGQALGYIGNSALGFVSTAIKGPGNFYKHIIQDTILNVGKAQWQSKWLMNSQLGISNVAKEFSFMNTLMGDPIVNLKVPILPNLSVKQNDFILGTGLINDVIDSVEVKLSLNNFGTVVPQTFKLLFTHSYQGAIEQRRENIYGLPSFRDTISFWIKTKDKPGQHVLQVTLDTENSIDEIYENDNYAFTNVDVASASVRDIGLYGFENPFLDSLILLSPSIRTSEPPSIILQLDNNENFSNPVQINYFLDTFYTKISLTTPPANKRTWLRYKLNDGAVWSNSLSYSKYPGSKYLVGDNYSWSKQSLQNLRVIDEAVILDLDTVNISIQSAGLSQYCIIAKNGINLLSNTFFQGIGIAVFDERTFKVDTTAWFELFNNLAGINACIQFINSIPAGKLVALGVSGDAKNNSSTDLNNAVVSLGGTRFPELHFKCPYALLGKKGADSTEVKQIIKGLNEGPIYLDTNLIVSFDYGSLITTQIGPSSQWRKLKVELENQNNSEIKFKPVGIRSDGTDSTFSELNLLNNEADLSFIPAANFPYLKIQSEFLADSQLNSPILRRLEVDHKGIAELGTNYQVAKITKDTLDQGETQHLSFFVYNAGDEQTGDFNVEVGVLKPDNSYYQILSTNLNLSSRQRQLVQVNYSTTFESGPRLFKISIDDSNKVQEYYKDNNVYLVSFYIKPDTTAPQLMVSFNGKEIVDGDFVERNPTIRMDLSDPSVLPIIDTSAISIYLDKIPIYFAQNSNISYSFNPTNPKLIVEYKPNLKEGEHTLKILANDGFGNLADSSGFQRTFRISDEAKILYVYNYPNPIKQNTYFTFRLTQVPDQIKIMVYTVAGRLVKEIVKTRNELSTDFNKIFWDCRDEDGDILGNGTYFYKVIMKAGDKTETSVNKLAIIR